MRIAIALRCRPFSHVPGNHWLLPQTEFIVQVFPTRLAFSSLQNPASRLLIDLKLQGPVRGFTVQLDAEARALCVWGEAKEGYFKYRIVCHGKQLALQNERKTFVLSHEGQDIACERSAIYPLPMGCQEKHIAIPRLSLGIHKAQEWEKIRMRADVREFFPIWHKLGSFFALSPKESAVGTLGLLAQCRELVYANKKNQIVEAFTELFLSALGPVFVPRLFDEEFQGILQESAMSKGDSPLPILAEGARLIEALFCREEQNVLSLLPCAPSRFPSGRMTDFFTRAGDEFAFEWTKHKLRRVKISPQAGKEKTLRFPKPLKRCRMRTSLREKGQILSMDDGFLVIPPIACLLDRFE